MGLSIILRTPSNRLDMLLTHLVLSHTRGVAEPSPAPSSIPAGEPRGLRQVLSSYFSQAANASSQGGS